MQKANNTMHLIKQRSAKKAVAKCMLPLLCFAACCGFSAARAADTLRVAQDGSADFTSIQKAIEATKAYPVEPVVILIKKGVYKEKVRVPAWNTDLSLIGEDKENTIITYDDYFKKIDKDRNSTFYTATLSIEAERVSVKNLTIINAAGPVGQALAISISADQCVIDNCNMDGHQDTFFATGSHTHVYVKNSRVAGTTDFLFGDATVLLDHCDIYCKTGSYIVAASTNKGQAFGFVLNHCKVSAASDVKHGLLGRTWRPYAKTVFLNSELGAFLAGAGWDNWRSKANETSSFYAEYGNTGAGANRENRAAWSHELTEGELRTYTPENILGAWVGQYL